VFEAAPGQTITISQDGLNSGLVVGYQVIKAATGTVAIGRSTTGVVERPSGSGNYVATFVAPVEADLYLVVMDWNNGHITATTSVVSELRVTSAAAATPTGLGLVADYTKMALGGAIFEGLRGDSNYGDTFIGLAIEAVKHRVMSAPPDTASEGVLPVVLLSYLGKLSALELMGAVRTMVGEWLQSKSTGADPTEIATYPDRVQILKDLQDRLLDEARNEQALAISMVDSPNLLSLDAPDIDEDDCLRVTHDPRHFPREETFPFHYPAYPGAVVWP
jgi:hypothetical protein